MVVGWSCLTMVNGFCQLHLATNMVAQHFRRSVGSVVWPSRLWWSRRFWTTNMASPQTRSCCVSMWVVTHSHRISVQAKQEPKVKHPRQRDRKLKRAKQLDTRLDLFFAEGASIVTRCWHWREDQDKVSHPRWLAFAQDGLVTQQRFLWLAKANDWLANDWFILESFPSVSKSGWIGHAACPLVNDWFAVADGLAAAWRT